MSPFNYTRSCSSKYVRIVISKKVRCFATQTILRQDDTVQSPRPFGDIPKPSAFTFLRSFMPGGEFHDVSILEYGKTMRDRVGNIFIMPGLFGRPDMVVTFDPKDIETVFRNEGQWPIRQGFDSVVYFREKVRPDIYHESTGFLAAQGEPWFKLRTAINPLLMQPRNLRAYIGPIAQIADEFVEHIKEIRDPGTLEVPATFEEEMSRLIFESIALIALNRRMGIIREKRDNPAVFQLFKTSRDIFRYIFKLDMQPSLWHVIATPTFKKMMKSLEDSLEVTQQFVKETEALMAEQKHAGASANTRSILERLIEIDPKIATVIAMDILFAGVDATSTVLSAVLLSLAKNPEKQVKLRDELFRIMPTQQTQLNEQNMKDLPYLRAVIKETLRYYPNGIGTIRNCVQDLELSGYHIPKGTRVMVGANVLMKDESYFPRPNEFLPERWLRDATTNKRIDISPFSYLPFGFGPRMCVGKRVVDMELEIILAKLVRHFKIEYNYDASKPYKAFFTMEPIIPFQFKFIDVPK